MEVVAAGGLTPAPFALCPGYNLLAVGMTSSSAAGEGAVESGASRVDVLRLLRPSGDLNLGETLQVDCFLHAPGLRRLAWSSLPTNSDSVLDPWEQLAFPAGLLAGGFENGAVRNWNPEAAMLCDLAKSAVPKKKKPALIQSEDPKIAAIEQAKILTGVANMYSDIKKLPWTYPEDKENFQKKEEESCDHWDMVEDDAESSGWELISKEETPADHLQTKKMQLITESQNLNGPVLGLSFNELFPYWIATGALCECICIHDLNYPMQLSKKKLELRETELIAQRQITCLKWSSTYPCVLGSTGEEGFLKLWDVRCRTPTIEFDNERGMSSSDLEFSLNNPMHVAVSTVNNGNSAAVKIWDMRHYQNLYHEYGIGASGVVSLSWNRSGQLLAAHTNGAISCYDVYKKKMLQEVDFPHSDLGLTWTHSDNVAAALSSQTGVKLCGIGG